MFCSIKGCKLKPSCTLLPAKVHICSHTIRVINIFHGYLVSRKDCSLGFRVGLINIAIALLVCTRKDSVLPQVGVGKKNKNTFFVAGQCSIFLIKPAQLRPKDTTPFLSAGHSSCVSFTLCGL